MAIKPSTTGNDKIKGTAKNDTIDGLAGHDTLQGLAGNDSLKGSAGNDSLDGGVGNDLLTGDAGKDALLGGSGHDQLDGGADSDQLDGGAGNDTLIGGTGVDALIGGDGNDTYLVDNSRDAITEGAGKLSGTDSVQSSVDYVLADNLENLQLTGLRNLKGVGNDGKNVITGNDGDNFLDGKNGFDTLKGGAGDDTLLGGGGVDQLVGGDGSDTYQVSSNEDQIVETARDGDQDVVESSVSYELGANLEVLTLTGSGNIDGTGNELDNTVEGNSGANNLQGAEGDDTLTGDGGNDTLDGGAGDDRIDGGTGADQVVYLGNEDDYKIFFDTDSATWVVEDVNGEDGDGIDEGRDELTGVEALVFADVTLNLTQGLTLAIDSIARAEGTGDADTAFDFTVTLSTAGDVPVTVDYAVLTGTATAGVDFTAASGTLSFAPGETTRTISVGVKADRLIETDETFTVQLSNPVGATLAEAKGTGTIQNDDSAELSIADVEIVEGNSGSQDAVLTVLLSAASTQPVTVSYATADGSATAGSDYVAATGKLTFAPGETSKTLAVAILGDTFLEQDEIVQVSLFSPENATLGTGSARLTIRNDDTPSAPVFTSGTTASVAENTAAGTLIYDATADGDLGVTYSLQGQDAGKFTLNAKDGTVKLAFVPDYEHPADQGGNNVYDFTVRATNATGQFADRAVALTVTDVAESSSPAGQAVIDLGSEYGKLIEPVNVDGHWYYYWDRSGDGTTANKQAAGYANANDYTTHDVLDQIFNQDINGAVGGGGNTDNTYRYVTLNGVHVALPTVGDRNERLISDYYGATGTAVGGSPDSAGSTAINPAYDDLLAVWDAYNGTYNGMAGAGYYKGTPPDWSGHFYWSATPSASGHAVVYLSLGGVAGHYIDGSTGYVALEVL
jgi:hypothetical protein